MTYLCSTDQSKKILFFFFWAVNMNLVLLFLMQIFAVFAKHNEWYCQEADQKYQICRKCKTLVEDCDKVAPKDCKCENLKFDKNDGSCKLEFIPKSGPSQGLKIRGGSYYCGGHNLPP